MYVYIHAEYQVSGKIYTNFKQVLLFSFTLFTPKETSKKPTLIRARSCDILNFPCIRIFESIYDILQVWFSFVKVLFG